MIHAGVGLALIVRAASEDDVADRPLPTEGFGYSRTSARFALISQRHSLEASAMPPRISGGAPKAPPRRGEWASGDHSSRQHPPHSAQLPVPAERGPSERAGDADGRFSADGVFSRGRNWGRVSTAVFAVCLDATAAFLMTTQQLPEATMGVGLAGLGWFVTGRLAVWHPQPTPATAHHQNGTT
jgi:hypothetical protein